ncbi:MAG: hypothetical protein IJ196_01255 [Prevotella sp.]|nr:hypothetical protein [Prevotella sp.]
MDKKTYIIPLIETCHMAGTAVMAGSILVNPEDDDPITPGGGGDPGEFAKGTDWDDEDEGLPRFSIWD